MTDFATDFSIYGLNGTGNTNMLSGLPFLEANATGPTTDNPQPDGYSGYKITATVGGLPGLRTGFGANWTTFRLANTIYISSLPSGNSNCYVFQPRDNANAAQCTVVIGASGQLIVKSGGESGTVLGSSANGVIPAGAHTHIETRFVINGTTGSIEIRVNEVTVLTLPNVNTAAAGGTTAASNAVRIVGGEINYMMIFSYSQRQSADTWGGDVQWFARWPNADAAATAWTRNTGAADFDMIDDGVPDEDATYLAASSPGDISQFGVVDLPATAATVIGVCLIHRARKESSGTSTYRVGLAEAAHPTNVALGATKSPATAYAYDYDFITNNPATGVPFTPAEWNSGTLYHIEKVA